MRLKTFDVSEYLDSPEMIAEYLTISAQQDETLFFRALGDVAKAVGMTQIANDAEISRTSLYKALNGRSRSTQYATINKIVKALGMRIEINTQSDEAA